MKKIQCALYFLFGAKVENIQKLFHFINIFLEKHAIQCKTLTIKTSKLALYHTIPGFNNSERERERERERVIGESEREGENVEKIVANGEIAGCMFSFSLSVIKCLSQGSCKLRSVW